MTVSTTTSRADYTGNGATTAFAVPFYFLEDSHLTVLRTQISTGVITTLALTTNYTVSGAGNPAGGTVTCVVAPTADQKISILRNVPLTQLNTYVPNDPFPAASHERALDKLTMEVQQLDEAIDRAIALPPNTPAGTVSAALPTPEANKFIGWNGSATGLQNLDASSLASVTSFANAFSDTFSGNGVQTVFTLSSNPGSQANLRVSISGVVQRPTIDYLWVSGTTLTFTSAPASGTNNILVQYTTAAPGVPNISSLGVNLSVSLEQFHTSGGGANATWQAALDAAAAAVAAAGGGEVTALRDRVYTFTGYPAVIPAGVLIRGRPNITRFVLPSTGGSLLQFVGSLGTSYTLNSNTAIGANTISLTTNTSLAVGDLLRITRTPPAPITLGTWTQIVEVESITGAGPFTVTIRGRAKFAVATTDTYTINRMVPHVGGGCVGVIFDGSNCNDTVTRTCQGIRALYTRNLYVDDIGGEDMDGQDPTNASTAASVLRMDGCYDTRGLQNLWAIRSGCNSVCDLQFTGSNGHFGNITSRDASGFGPGWYNCFDVHVNSITSQFPEYRAGKMQCTLDFTLNSVISDQPGYTGFGFTEGSKGLIRSAIYNPSRNTAPTQPSFWCNNTGVEIAVGQIRLAQATNTSGDIHTGSNDKVWIYDVVTDGFTPTYAGTAGSSANGTGRNIARVDGVRLFEAQSQFPDGTAGAPSVTNVGDLDTGIYWSADNTLAITTAGSRRFEVNNNGRVGIPAANNSALFYLTATAQQPAQFWFDNFYYVTFGSNAATNGSTGFNFITKNGAGVDYTSFLLAQADRVQIQAPDAGILLFGRGNAPSGGSFLERLRIDSTGNVIVTGPGGLGYGTGSGGTVTQATSRTTGVTIDKTNGSITLVSAAGTATWQSFTVTNNTVAATDTIVLSQRSGTDLYMLEVTAVAAGSFRISFATTGGTTTEQPVFNFAVIKAVTA